MDDSTFETTPTQRTHRTVRHAGRLGRTARSASRERAGAAVASTPASVGPALERRSSLERSAKRVLDVFLLAPAVVIAMPIVAIAAMWVAAVSPGNPFYFQTREGHRGRPIRVWKIRTMHRDAEALLAQHLASNREARSEWDTWFKLVDDPRIVPGVGAFLRRSSLDELPQLYNILRGDMSFVGPRPFPEYHLAAFDDAFRELRRSVPPGLTGLWQVSARSDGDTAVQKALDSQYVRTWSIWLDLRILARTPVAVLGGKGAR